MCVCVLWFFLCVLVDMIVEIVDGMRLVSFSVFIRFEFYMSEVLVILRLFILFVILVIVLMFLVIVLVVWKMVVLCCMVFCILRCRFVVGIVFFV